MPYSEDGTYKSSVFTKIAIVASLSISAALLPAVMTSGMSGINTGIDTGGAPAVVNEATPTPGEIPTILPFGAEANLPESTNMALILPADAKWKLASQSNQGKTLVYVDEASSCNAKTELREADLASYGKTAEGSQQASLSALSSLIGTPIQSSSENLTINDIQYNMGSSAQALSVGYSLTTGGSSWSFVRAILPTNTYYALTINCKMSSEDGSFYEYVDGERTKFGFALS